MSNIMSGGRMKTYSNQRISEYQLPENGIKAVEHKPYVSLYAMQDS